MTRPPLVSSLSASFRRATTVTEDVEEAKKEHRQTLFELSTKYLEDVKVGKAEGIRNAKELVEVMKMDLLLLGEATDRTENSSMDEVRINQLSQHIPDTEEMADLMQTMLMSLNNSNDDADVASSKKQKEFAKKELDKFKEEPAEVDTEAKE